MRWFQAVVPVLFVLAVALGLFILRTHYTAGLTGDLSLHVALARLLSEEWRVAGPMLPALGIMVDYPVGAHLVAALVTQATASPLLAVSGLSWVYALLAYVFLLLLAGRLGWLAPLLASAALLALYPLVAGALPPGGFLVGFEVIGTYFHAQLAGTALYCGLLLLLARVARPDSWVTLLGVVGGVALLLWVHIVPAMQLAAAYGCWLVIAVVWGWSTWRVALWRLVSFAILLLAVALLSPEFATMLRFYREHGQAAISIGLAKPLTLTLIFAALTGCATLLGLWLSRQRAPGPDDAGRALAWVVAGAAGAAGLVVTQFGALLLGFGEGKYGTLKHVYLLVTLAVFALAAVAGRAWGRPLPGALRRWHADSLVAIALALLLVLLQPARLEDLRPAAQAYDAAHRLRSAGLPAGALGSTIVTDSGLPSRHEYGIAMSEFYFPDGDTAYLVLRGRAVPADQARFALVGSGTPTAQACAVPGLLAGGLQLVDYPCYRSAVDVYRLGERIVFGLGGATALLREGWKRPQASGIWLADTAATLRLPLPSDLPAGEGLRLRFELRALVVDAVTRQTVALTADGVPVATWRIDTIAVQALVAELPADLLSGRSAVTLSILLDQPRILGGAALALPPNLRGLKLIALTAERL